MVALGVAVGGGRLLALAEGWLFLAALPAGGGGVALAADSTVLTAAGGCSGWPLFWRAGGACYRLLRLEAAGVGLGVALGVAIAKERPLPFVWSVRSTPTLAAGG